LHLSHLAGGNECRLTKKLTIPPLVSYSARQGINGTTKQANLIHRTNKLRLNQGPTLFQKKNSSIPP
jgi:hypothetical protein